MDLSFFILAFILTAGFGLAVWWIGLITKVHRAKRPQKLTDETGILGREEATLKGHPIVTFRDIRMQSRKRAAQPVGGYDYTDGFSVGVPDVWVDELEQRKN